MNIEPHVFYKYNDAPSYQRHYAYLLWRFLIESQANVIMYVVHTTTAHFGDLMLILWILLSSNSKKCY